MYKYNHKVIGSNEGFWMIMIKSNIACTTRGILRIELTTPPQENDGK